MEWKLKVHGLMWLITRPPTDKERELYDIAAADERGMNICGISKDETACIGSLDDALMIVAAPQMLRTLQSVLALSEEPNDFLSHAVLVNVLREIHRAAQTAIQKATGQG